MTQSVTKYSVFIASPGDVHEEREATIEVIQRWNNLNSKRSKIILEPLLWETGTAPDFDRSPQDTINMDLLARADLLVAILWSRAGTPTHTHASGTLEEIARFGGRKMVYFCQRSRPTRPGTDDAEQAAAVDKFQKAHAADGYCRSFNETAEFKELLFDNLTHWSNDLPTILGPSELVDYDQTDNAPTLLQEWGRGDEEGTVLIYNAELGSFQDRFRFQEVWGTLSQQRCIRKIILLLPRYKELRLREFLAAHPPDDGSLEPFSYCPLQLGGVHAADAPSGIGFVMFVKGPNPVRGEPHRKALVFVLAPPFSDVERRGADSSEPFWNYHHAIEIRERPDFTRELHALFANQYNPDAEKPLTALLEPSAPESPLEDAIVNAFEEGRSGPDFYRLFEKARRIRERLFDPNVPTYVLDEDFFILDWNPTFEMIFPTERFNRGDFVRKFLVCLSNYEKTLESGKEFMNDNKPLFHCEGFVYDSPRYGRMAFTKVTSPVRNADRQIIGWNVALNIDEVEHRALFNDDRRACVELDALLTRYAASYDRITADFREYKDLVGAHVTAMGDMANVLDLGCGPGMLTSRLLRSGKRVTAIDCNDAMLDRLRERCRKPIEDGRLRVAKANVEVLNGLRREFEGAVMLNVLYSVKDKEACLKRLHEVLVDGAPIAISGPRADADLEELFAEIVRTKPRLAPDREVQWREDFAIFKEVNCQLQRSGLLHALSMESLVELMEKNGFDVDRAASAERIYAGQGMLVVGRRRPTATRTVAQVVEETQNAAV